MTRLLETVRDFSLLSGLQVNIDKCAGFHVQPFRRTWLINSRDPWKMSGKNIPALKPGDTSRYLGANIDPWTGVPEVRLGEDPGELVPEDRQVPTQAPTEDRHDEDVCLGTTTIRHDTQPVKDGGSQSGRRDGSAVDEEVVEPTPEYHQWDLLHGETKRRSRHSQAGGGDPDSQSRSLA